jgi:hypothetical protein
MKNDSRSKREDERKKERALQGWRKVPQLLLLLLLLVRQEQTGSLPASASASAWVVPSCLISVAYQLF